MQNLKRVAVASCQKLRLNFLHRFFTLGVSSSSSNIEKFLSVQTLQIQNGKKITPIFSNDEFQRRLTLLRNKMETEGIGGVVFTSIQNVAYFSNFLYIPFGRPYGLVVTPQRNVTVSALVDYSQPWRVSYDENVIYTDWKRDNFFHAVKDLLKDVKGTIGYEADHLSVQNYGKLLSALPLNKLVDIGESTERMRMIKSPEEIKLTKHGARIADLGGAAVVDAVDEGVPEYEVANHAIKTMVVEIAKTFPSTELRDIWAYFQSGINTDGAHNPVTSRRIQKGDILSFSCFPMINGYYVSVERTLFFDHVSDEHLKYWEGNIRVYRKGLELIKAGKRCCDIALELNNVFAEEGLLDKRTFGYGHSFGVMCHYYGREAALELREDIDTVLEPGMVISMEPMITIPEGQPGAGGYREHDILVITDRGTENITRFPVGPEYNVIKK
ncbi:creatinase-like [Tachypleus tridentatus]|uniref:creatinase-like n=1 Tax=Tachypleus tridentatus TaxID=6853 RepID=UPI003FCFCA9B